MRRFQYAIGESGIYEAVTEFDAGTVRHHHAFGPGVDEPVLRWDVGSVHLLHADERGSIVAQSDGSGNVAVINRYDEFGKPQAGNVGRFQYTGQLWMPEVGLYHYKARAYAPHLGQFLQTDPAGGTNLYAYVGNDPIGSTDPSGMIPERFGLAGDDMSRFIDVSPQGTGRGTHSYDGLGGSIPVFHVGGRSDVIEYQRALSRLPQTMAQLGIYSAATGVTIGCLLTCSDSEIRSQATFHADIVNAGFSGGQGWGGGGAGADYGLPFADLKDHWRRHGEALGTQSPQEYLEFARNNVDVGQSFRFRTEGQQRLAHITRMGQMFVFTSTNLSVTRIYTHMLVNQQYLRNKGITLPRGF